MGFKDVLSVILLSGKAEAGKTTAAKAMKEALAEHGMKAVIVPYGQYVKDTAKMLFGWDGVKDEAGRQLLQQWGTNTVRKIDPMFWCDTVMRLARVLKEDDEICAIIIDDCRFPNEISCWENDEFNYWNIMKVRIERPGWENALTLEQRQHPSETALDDYKNWSWIIETDDVNILRSQARFLMTGEVE